MPELPEVETTLRGIQPHIQSQIVTEVIIRHPTLRWPISPELPTLLPKQTLQKLTRRAKYLLLEFDTGTLLIHLGMSGSLKVITANENVKKHDHIDILFANGKGIRLTDPRRFGAVLWLGHQPEQHMLLAKLGLEPFSDDFTADYLYQRSRKRRVSIKQFLMNQQIVTGVGNIYCAESLFAAKISPLRAAKDLSLEECASLVDCIKVILAAAIEQGGTTLRDFVGSDGKAGYFQQTLNVYGRGGQRCVVCDSDLIEIKQAQRATVYCQQCQL